MLKDISLKFLQATLLCCWYLLYKMRLHRPPIKKVMSFQSQKSGKVISPFLSDRVTYQDSKSGTAVDMDQIGVGKFPQLGGKGYTLKPLYGVRNPCDFNSQETPDILFSKPHTIREPQIVANHFARGALHTYLNNHHHWIVVDK